MVRNSRDYLHDLIYAVIVFALSLTTFLFLPALLALCISGFIGYHFLIPMWSNYNGELRRIANNKAREEAIKRRKLESYRKEIKEAGLTGVDINNIDSMSNALAAEEKRIKELEAEKEARYAEELKLKAASQKLERELEQQCQEVKELAALDAEINQLAASLGVENQLPTDTNKEDKQRYIAALKAEIERRKMEAIKSDLNDF